METPIRHRFLRRLIWVCAVCIMSHIRTLGLYGLNPLRFSLRGPFKKSLIYGIYQLYKLMKQAFELSDFDYRIYTVIYLNNSMNTFTLRWAPILVGIGCLAILVCCCVCCYRCCCRQTHHTTFIQSGYTGQPGEKI